MLQGFADESEGKVVSLTGCVLPYPQWDAFLDDWNKTLAEAPTIKYFHMREARALEGEFKGFTTTMRDMKLIRLVSVVLQHNPQVLTAWLVKEDYLAIVGRPAQAWEASQVYLPCFTLLLYMGAAQSARRQDKLPIDFVFDKKGDLERVALLWYPETLKAADENLRPYFGATPIFRDDMDVIPLQIADLVGWHIHRKLEIPGKDIERFATQRLDDLQLWEQHLSPVELRELSAQFLEITEGNPLTPLMSLKPSKRRKEVAKLKRRFKRRIESLYDQGK